MHLHRKSSKKRKLGAETNDCEAQSVNREMLLTLHNMDVDIFGLFLTYIYRGAYPVTMDAPLNATMAKGDVYVSRFAGSSYTEGRKATTFSPTVFDSIPPSIRAWLLAQRLRSVSFMNHAITHVYHGIGRHFALTPGLVDYVWVHTAPCPAHTATTPPPPPTLSSSSAATTPPPTHTKVDDDESRSCKLTTAKNLAIVTPSPLRALVLSFLVTYWPAHGNHIIARNQQSAWDALFVKHMDLRRNFIFGLQEGGKLMSVQGYFAQPQGSDVLVKQERGEVKTAA
jgi:hypothetical protein